MRGSNIFFYRYKLKFCFDGGTPEVAGITYGENWAEVMQHLVDHYGEDDICEITMLEPISDGGFCVDFEELETYAHLKEEKTE